MTGENNKLAESDLADLNVGAMGYFKRLREGYLKGHNIHEMVEAIKTESTLDSAKKNLLGDALMKMIKVYSNKNSK